MNTDLSEIVAYSSRKLILVRHSAVELQVDVPAKFWRLSADGRSRAAALAPKIAPHTPSRFVTSTEPKAEETGQIMADLLGVPCITADGLHEHDRTGVPFMPDKAQFEAAVARFFTEPDKLVLGRETAVQAQTRFVNAINAVMVAYPTDNIAIVTHGTVLTLFATQHQPDLDAITFWKSLSLPCKFIVDWPVRKN